MECLRLFSKTRVIEWPIVRPARPSRSDRDVGGAVKRDLLVTVPQSHSEKRRVVLASFRLLLVVCFLCAQTLFQVAAAQAPPDDNKPKDDPKKEEPKKEESKNEDAKVQVDDVHFGVFVFALILLRLFFFGIVFG